MILYRRHSAAGCLALVMRRNNTLSPGEKKIKIKMAIGQVVSALDRRTNRA